MPPRATHNRAASQPLDGPNFGSSHANQGSPKRNNQHAGRATNSGSRKRANGEDTDVPSTSPKRARGGRGTGRAMPLSRPLQIPLLPTPRPSPAQTHPSLPIGNQDSNSTQLPVSPIKSGTRDGYERYKNRRRNADEYLYENLDEHKLHDDKKGLEHVPAELFTKKDLIRVLTLHPGNSPEVYCSLDVVQLPGLDERGRVKDMYEYGKKKEVVQYQALSYAWGEKPPSMDLFIQTANGSHQKLKITESLHSALKMLRHPTGQSRKFWADAVCMNQSDDEEKSKQLALMARIYREATNVCVWLGTGDKDTITAFKLIDTIRDTTQYNDFVEKTKQEDWIAFAKLLQETWFSRRWIVQEISLATGAEIWCGNAKRSWDNFCEAVSLFVLVADRVKDLFRKLTPDKFGDIAEFSANQLVTITNNVVWRDDEHRAVQKIRTLEYLVSKLTPFEAGDPRDIVYSMLSLAEDVNGITTGPISEYKPLEHVPKELLQLEHLKYNDPAITLRAVNNVRKYWKIKKFPVDYSKNFLDVFLDLLKFTTRKSNSLDIICRPWAPRRATLRKARVREMTKHLADKIALCTENEEQRRKELVSELEKEERLLNRKIREDPIVPSWIRTLDDAPFRHNKNAFNGLEDSYRWDRTNPDTLVGLPGESPYSASGRVAGDWTFTQDQLDDKKLLLTVKGFAFDELSDVEPNAPAGVVPYQWLKYVEVDEEKYSPLEATSRVSTISDAFWRTTVAGRAPNTHDGRNPPPYYRRLCEATFHTNHEEDINIEKQRISTTNELHKAYLKRIEAVVFRRSLTKLRRCGRLALVPGSAHSGDLVCILFGCSVPVILRRLQDQTIDVNEVVDKVTTKVNRPLYQLIGECYVHGVMEGEAFNIRHDARTTHPLTRRKPTKEEREFYDYKYFYLR